MIACSINRPVLIALLVILITFILSGCQKTSFIQESEAFRSQRTEAMAGNVESQYRLGMRYTNGHGVMEDYAAAADWFERAASGGHTEAQFMIGIAYYAGRGVGQNHPKAINWFQKAADAGHMRAQYQLGDAYMNGRSVTKDRAWGGRWYGMAAVQGHKEAQFYLGAFFSKGLGLPKSTANAVFWSRLAERNGHPHASKALDNLRGRLPQSQYLAAIKKADQWTPVEKLKGFNNQPTLRYIQYVLNRLGYRAGFADGVRGPKTEQAMSQYRKDKGIKLGSDLEQIVTELRKSSPTLH